MASFRAWLVCAAFAALIGVPSLAQEQPAALPEATQGVLIVNRDLVLAESEPARQLRELERQRRIALQASFEEINRSLEAEEAEIAEVRGRLSADEFEARVREFDLRVREARRSSQEANETLQAEFVAARRNLAQALNPILQDILISRGAIVMLNAQTVLMARGDIDVTREAIERFSTLEIDFGLEPVAAGDSN